MRIAVIDGQGGGIGRALVERLRHEFGDQVRITALGTNSSATEQMMRAGAHEGATGENAICYGAARADIITGVVAIAFANALLGEVTPKVAEAVTTSDARKILIPFNRCNVEIVGVPQESLSARIDGVVQGIRRVIAARE